VKSFYIILLLFVISCSSKSIENNNFDFSDKISFEEFKIKLNEYAIKNTYPNIDY